MFKHVEQHFGPEELQTTQ